MELEGQEETVQMPIGGREGVRGFGAVPPVPPAKRAQRSRCLSQLQPDLPCCSATALPSLKKNELCSRMCQPSPLLGAGPGCTWWSNLGGRSCFAAHQQSAGNPFAQ